MSALLIFPHGECHLWWVVCKHHCISPHKCSNKLQDDNRHARLLNVTLQITDDPHLTRPFCWYLQNTFDNRPLRFFITGSVANTELYSYEIHILTSRCHYNSMSHPIRLFSLVFLRPFLCQHYSHYSDKKNYMSHREMSLSSSMESTLTHLTSVVKVSKSQTTGEILC